MTENDENCNTNNTVELVGTALQGLYFVVFIVPSIYLLVRKWQHLDLYSKSMIIIYQISMCLKFLFYLTELFLEEKTTS